MKIIFPHQKICPECKEFMNPQVFSNPEIDLERIEGLFEENPPITERQLFIECMKWFAVGFLFGIAIISIVKFQVLFGG